MNQGTRKLITMHMALHLKERERELTSVGDSLDVLIRRLEDYIKKSEERLMTALAT